MLAAAAPAAVSSAGKPRTAAKSPAGTTTRVEAHGQSEVEATRP
jgi:hypothetical protein